MKNHGFWCSTPIPWFCDYEVSIHCRAKVHHFSRVFRDSAFRWVTRNFYKWFWKYHGLRCHGWDFVPIPWCRFCEAMTETSIQIQERMFHNGSKANRLKKYVKIKSWEIRRKKSPCWNIALFFHFFDKLKWQEFSEFRWRPEVKPMTLA